MTPCHALRGKTSPCSRTAFPLPYPDVLLECVHARWHVAVHPAHQQSSKHLDLGLLVVLPLCRGRVPGSMATALAFSSLTLPGDPSVLYVCACQHTWRWFYRGWQIGSCWHLCGTQGREIDILLSELVLSHVGFQEASLNSVAKPTFYFVFSFDIFFHQKSGDRWLGKRNLKIGLQHRWQQNAQHVSNWNWQMPLDYY